MCICLEATFKLVLDKLNFPVFKNQQPKKTARCWCKRAVESGVRVRYRLRPLADSSSAGEMFFIETMYHNLFVEPALVRLIGRS